jgi:tetratricopeptide (TPR) repeat protein
MCSAEINEGVITNKGVTMNVSTLLVRGQKSFRKKDIAKALDFYEQALQSDPQCGPVYLHRAIALSARHAYPEAVTAIEKAIKIDPTNSVYHVYAGMIHFEHDHIKDAVESFKRSVKLNPDYHFPKQFLALIDMEHNAVREGLHVLKTYGLVDNELFNARLFRVFDRLLRTGTEEQRSQIRSFLRDFFHLEEPKADVLTRCLAKFKKLTPTQLIDQRYIDKQLQKAEKFMNMPAYSECVTICRPLLDKGPSSEQRFMIHMILGESYLQLERFADAESSYKKANQIDHPDKPYYDLYYRIGLCQFKQELFTEATASLTEALTTENEEIKKDALFHLGQIPDTEQSRQASMDALIESFSDLTGRELFKAKLKDFIQ